MSSVHIQSLFSILHPNYNSFTTETNKYKNDPFLQISNQISNRISNQISNENLFKLPRPKQPQLQEQQEQQNQQQSLRLHVQIPTTTGVTNNNFFTTMQTTSANEKEQQQQQQRRRQNELETENEWWRPENRGALVHRGDPEDTTLAGQLLYAATHTDASQKRHLANLIAKERMYRRTFCGQTIAPSDDGLDAVLENGDMAFIKYKDEERELNLETLCAHIEQLIEMGYSLTYIFAYLSYLRRKYRGSYPKLRAQTSAFYRTLIDNYEKQRRLKPRIGTDEVYTCEERIYNQMYVLAHEYFFSQTCRLDEHNAANETRLTATGKTVNLAKHDLHTNRMLFCYVYMFMYITGKRLSEISLLGVEQLNTLSSFEALVIRIPKSKKLGRIVMRDYDEETKRRVKYLLKTTVKLFDCPDNIDPVIPFDQYEKRRTLDRCFNALYMKATNQTKPRGLSLHSLRRFRAATLFAQGRDIEHIRECLDHSSVRVTNMYINKHLMRTYRTTGNSTKTPQTAPSLDVRKQNNPAQDNHKKQQNRRKNRHQNEQN